MLNPRTGKVEHVFVNLETVYPNPNDPHEEYSFEELRARYRGWLDRDWQAEKRSVREQEQHEKAKEALIDETEPQSPGRVAIVHADYREQDIEDNRTEDTLGDADTIKEESGEGGSTRPRKKRVMEIKGETQTSKRNDLLQCIYR